MPVLLAALGLKVPGFNALTAAIAQDLGTDLTLQRYSPVPLCPVRRVLGLKPEALKRAFAVLEVKPFVSPAKALEFVEVWDSVSEAGFTSQQLAYVLKDWDDEPQPVRPTRWSMLQAALTIYTGLLDIDTQVQESRGCRGGHFGGRARQRAAALQPGRGGPDRQLPRRGVGDDDEEQQKKKTCTENQALPVRQTPQNKAPLDPDDRLRNGNLIEKKQNSPREPPSSTDKHVLNQDGS